jgi:pimeloyl-ACP methyl ester carboxylesterase
MKTLPAQQQTGKIILFMAFFLTGTLSYAHAQDIAGQWNGVLSIQGMNLRLVFHITETDAGYASAMDSPDQGAKGIPVATTSFDGSKLLLAVPGIGLTYEGEFHTDSIAGTFKQGGLSLPMTLKRTPVEKQTFHRPQEPKPPYPYRMENVTFENKATGITLAGTLTMPPTGSNFPAVILITGSGAQNRDEELMGHKPFLVIADYLTRHGIAVLRYDDRGTAQSTGNFSAATTADFATDAGSAIAYLKTRKEINSKRIGLIGHSEGAIIAPMVAVQSNDDVGFIVMLAGTGLRGDRILLMQQELIARASGASENDIRMAAAFNRKIFETVIKDSNPAQLEAALTETIRQAVGEIPDNAPTKAQYGDDFIKASVARISSPWMQYFIRYDPAPALKKVRCPVLAVNGSKDLQVPARENIEAIRTALGEGGNPDTTIREYSGLNHLFQECTTGSPAEYAVIEQTFSPDVLKDISDWILKK